MKRMRAASQSFISSTSDFSLAPKKKSNFLFLIILMYLITLLMPYKYIIILYKCIVSGEGQRCIMFKVKSKIATKSNDQIIDFSLICFDVLGDTFFDKKLIIYL